MTNRSATLVTIAISAAAGLAFLLATLPGDYTWFTRLGGATWVTFLALIILLPTLNPWLRSRTGEQGNN